MERRKLYFNVGGCRLETYSSTIAQRCGVKWLTHLKEQSSCEGPDEYFLDRNPVLFQCVLDYCRTGHLHVPHNLCGPFIREELKFWDISPSLIRPCCWTPFMTDDQQRFAGKQSINLSNYSCLEVAITVLLDNQISNVFKVDLLFKLSFADCKTFQGHTGNEILGVLTNVTAML